METNLANIVVLIEYLREHYKRIGAKKYQESLVAREHGIGTGFGGVSNGGSGDCLKEQFRSLGCALGAKHTHINKLYFNTSSALSVDQVSRTNKNFRVEHTIELAGVLYPEIEKQFIFSEKVPTEQAVLDWFVEQHICVGIHPLEQKTKKTHGQSADDYKLNNYQYPFKKYNATVFYKGKNVSNLTRSQISQINKNQHSKLALDRIKYKKMYDVVQKRLQSVQGKGHKLCPQQLAEKYYNDCNPLLYHHYRYKFLEKVGDPSDTKWYNKGIANNFRLWEKKNDLIPI